MQMKFANRDELAWEKGELAYTAGDTLDMAIRKAMEAGFRPGSNGYAAFITAFSRQVRNRSMLHTKAMQQNTQDQILDTAMLESGIEQCASHLQAQPN